MHDPHLRTELAEAELTRMRVTRRSGPSAENLLRWAVWWKYVLFDQTALWAFGCVVGMYLNVNLALAIVPESAEISGYSVGAFQARYMAEKLWAGTEFVHNYSPYHSNNMSATIGGPIVQSLSACSLIAATSFGCWWPIETLTSCDAKSRYRFPS